VLKRLVDEEGLDDSDRRLSDLFRAAAPFDADPFRKRRIWVQLERGCKPGTRRRRFWLRPMVVAALLVSGTATALGHRFVLRGSGFFGLEGGSPSATSSSVKVSRHSTSSSKRAPTANTDAASAPAPAPVELVPVEPDASIPRATTKNTRPRPGSGEDATHVVEAIQALRTDRDPARAQALLNDYLKANPRGALSGDALALSIEAASAQHDPRAAEYARRYLAAYPKGKYRDLAKRALEASR
jgi:hypothetical protein